MFIIDFLSHIRKTGAILRLMFFVGMFPLFMACDSTAGGKGAASDGTGVENDSAVLKVGVRQTLDCLPAFVAQDEGIFDSLGVNVRLVHFTSQLDCDASILKKTIHGAYIDQVNMEHLRKSNDFLMVNMMNTDLQWTLVANHKSRLHKVNQLKDKLVAMTRNSATDMLCDRLIDSAKLVNERVFRIQVNDVDVRLKMLLNDEVDAAWLPEPHSTVAMVKGGNALMRSGREGEKLAVLAFSFEVLNNKEVRKRIDLFTQGLRLAESRMKKRGESYRKSLIKRYYNFDI